MKRNAAFRLRKAAMNVIRNATANSGEYGGCQLTRSRAKLRSQNRRNNRTARSAGAISFGSSIVHGVTPNSFGRKGKTGFPVKKTMRPVIGAMAARNETRNRGMVVRRLVPSTASQTSAQTAKYQPRYLTLQALPRRNPAAKACQRGRSEASRSRQ